jgi:hypothetical protein
MGFAAIFEHFIGVEDFLRLAFSTPLPVMQAIGQGFKSRGFVSPAMTLDITNA